MRMTRRSKGNNAEFYVIEVTPTAEHSAEFHNGEELNAKQRHIFESLICDDFPELPHSVNSPHVSGQWDNPIATTCQMKRQRLKILSHAERAELNRQLKDVVEAGLFRFHREFGSAIRLVRKVDGSLRLCVDLTRLRIRMATHFRVWMTPLLS
jgi:hypothetical protein